MNEKPIDPDLFPPAVSPKPKKTFLRTVLPTVTAGALSGVGVAAILGVIFGVLLGGSEPRVMLQYGMNAAIILGGLGGVLGLGTGLIAWIVERVRQR